jgi:hypothetical protein
MRSFSPRGELVISIDAVPSEGGVHVGVRDIGPGLSSENLSRLFEPFYTTKPEGMGMGMGLSICRLIIEAHGGNRGGHEGYRAITESLDLNLFETIAVNSGTSLCAGCWLPDRSSRRVHRCPKETQHLPAQ